MSPEKKRINAQYNDQYSTNVLNSWRHYGFFFSLGLLVS